MSIAEKVSKKIFDVMETYSDETMPPVAYVSVELGFECPFTDKELMDAFNSLKWDTNLSSTELLIQRKPQTTFQEDSVVLGGFSVFSDGTEGKIDEKGPHPTFCFVGKEIM